MRQPGRRMVLLIVAACLALIFVFSRSSVERPAPILAQTDVRAACDALIVSAIQHIGSSCRELGRNEVCYGNTQVSATLNDPQLVFDAAGDIVSIMTLQAIITRPANPETNEWGIAVMDLQADLPESETDSLHMVMFGGVDVEPTNAEPRSTALPTCNFVNNADELTNVRSGPGTRYHIVDILDRGVSIPVYGISPNDEWLRSQHGWVYARAGNLACDDSAELAVMDDMAQVYSAPMQSFTLQVTDAGECQAAPSGLLVQAPRGETANIMINNVEIRIGSTALVTMSEANDIMTVANLEGNVAATALEDTRVLLPGMEVEIEITNGVASSVPGPSKPLNGIGLSIDPRLLAALPEPVSRPAPYVFNTPTGSGDDEDCAGCVVVAPINELTCEYCGSTRTCNVGESFPVTFTYTASDGTSIAGHTFSGGTATITTATETITTPNQRGWTVNCDGAGITSVSLIIDDTAGRRFSAAFTVQVN